MQQLSSQELEKLIPSVVTIAEEAAARILEIYQSDFSIQRKDDKTPLTAADIAAHNTIETGLEKLHSKWPVLSEESASVVYQTRKQWPRYWLVDPLDGTREFIKRNGEFTVNIALIEHHESVLGVVYVPITKVCYFAARGIGAFKQMPGENPTRLRSRKTELDHVVVAGSRSHRDPHIETFLQKLPSYELRSIGSSLKSCLVAEGEIDVYPRLGPTSEWDTAAAQCVVEEAGGRLCDTNLQPLRYNMKESLLNPHFIAYGDPNFNWAPYLV